MQILDLCLIACRLICDLKGGHNDDAIEFVIRHMNISLYSSVPVIVQYPNVYEMRWAIDLQVDPEETKLVWELPRPALLCSVMLPVGRRGHDLYGGMV